MSPHGTRSRYTNHACTCNECTRANYRYHIAYRRGQRHVTYVNVTQDLLDHVAFLTSPGHFSKRALARHIQMNWQSFHDLTTAKTRRITKQFADRLLATSLWDLHH